MKQANAKQKQWMSDISEWAEQNLGVLYSGYCGGSFELHHVVGRSGKQNKVAIGHEFILPVPFELHNVMSDHTDNVTHFKKNFVKRFGTQRSLFECMIADMRHYGIELPDDEIITAIMNTSA